MTKFCVVCGKMLTGLQTVLCSDRECYRQRDAERKRKEHQNNREKINERRRKNYQNNQEKINERRREYRRKNSEKIKEQMHKHYQNNQEKYKEWRREYYLNNRERVLERSHKRYRDNRGLPEDWDLSKESSIEVIMRRWLQESDIAFIQQYYINFEDATNTRVDFYIPKANVCLYVDGDYWHGPDRPDIQERDARINKTLKGMGYVVFRISESDILEGARPIGILELVQ